MAGHVFIMRGDLRRLACDAWLMPCNRHAWPEPYWLLPGWEARLRPIAPTSDVAPAPQVWRLPEWPADRPRPYLTQIGTRAGREVDWYLTGVRRFVAAAAGDLAGRRPLFGRPRPLIALPVVGAGRGGAAFRSREVLRELLPVLYEAAATTGFDLALMTFGGPALAAAQADRHRLDGGAWTELPGPQAEAADALALRAGRGELALFLGAGVSCGAGVPLWGGLLDELAAAAGMPGSERDDLRQLDPLDQAAILERRFGGRARLHAALRELFLTRWDTFYAPAHLLPAALPVADVITTNFDRLFETAWTDVLRTRPDRDPPGGRPSVLPHAARPGAVRRLLKMHGCVTDPSEIVLTRGDFLGYSRRREALAGIVQAMLLTRHMLFVGFSMDDDNFHRIADSVRQVVRPGGAAAGAGGGAFGTMLRLGRNRLVEELWSGDLVPVCMADAPEAVMAPADRAAAARTLEIFLDRLLARTRDAAHLLDPAHQEGLTDEERNLRAALAPLASRLPPPGPDRHPAWTKIAGLLEELGHRTEG